MNQLKTILVIDDDRKFSFGLASTLRLAGFQVLNAFDGEEGLDVIRSKNPNLILSDIMMPPPNGIQLKKELMADPKTSGIPFLFLTGQPKRAYPYEKIMQQNSGQESLGDLINGADDYITKPFDADELIARIHSVLRRDELGYQRRVQETAANEGSRLSINSISHELRTQLTIILASLDLMAKKKPDDSTEELDECLMMANKGAHRIKFLVEGLEILDDVDRGHLNTFHRIIDLQLHFKTPIMQVFETWENKKLDLHVDINPNVTIYSPRHEFSHVVAQLVDNACKFSHKNGKVTVSVEPNGVGGCVFEVTDEGDGIPLDLREKVFDRYYQISQGDARKYGGLGIGLTIAHAFVHSVGGEIQIVDSPVGCRIRMTLPPLCPRSNSPYVH